MQQLYSHTLCRGTSRSADVLRADKCCPGFCLKEVAENLDEKRTANKTVANVTKLSLTCRHDFLKK